MITDHVAGTLSDLDREVVRHVQPGGNWRDLPSDFPSQRIDQIRRSAAAGEGSRSTYYGRLMWDRPSYTISTFFSRPGNGCFIHPTADRLITIREAARLQSFPDAYKFAGPMRSRFVQVGNAVPPLLACQLAAMFERGSVVDLFSGCGGMSLGFELAGFELVAVADIDQHSNETFAKNHPDRDAPIDLDLSDHGEHRVAMKEITRRVGSSGVDVLVGGPPCQGFSTAGNCKPDDPRNRLVFSFVAAVAELRPRALMMENVAALLFRRGIHVLRSVVTELAALGYETSLGIAHAEGYGVPQLRRRLFLTATHGRARWPDPWCDLRPPGHFRLQPHRAGVARLPGPTVRDAIADLPLGAVTDLGAVVDYASDASSQYQQWARGEISVDEMLPEPVWVAAEHPTMAEAVVALRSRP